MSTNKPNILIFMSDDQGPWAMHGGNTVLVRADNRYELRAAMPRHIDWNRYRGITRPVWLHLREHAYLGGPGEIIVRGGLARVAIRSNGKGGLIRVTMAGQEGLAGSVSLAANEFNTGPAAIG